MKKLLFIFIFFLVVNFVFAKAISVDVNVLRQIIVDILQKSTQEGQTPILTSTYATSTVQVLNSAETKIIQPQAIDLPKGIMPALPQDIKTTSITPEVIKPILPDEDRSNDAIVQINNLRITRILLDSGIQNIRAVFFAVRDVGWRCMFFQSEENEKSAPCFLNLRRPILQRELVIQINNDTILLQRNRQRAKLEDFQIGDKINVYGFMDKSNNSIDALIVRNLNLPRALKCLPRPACLDQNPRCLLPEPPGGWCSTVVEPRVPITSTSITCERVITYAYNPQNLLECKKFPTPCDVPPGWIITKKCPVIYENPPKQCFVGGCSGQICSDKPDVVTTCEWKPEYACYKKFGKCEIQINNQCGWTMTEELRKCLGK